MFSVEINAIYLKQIINSIIDNGLVLDVGFGTGYKSYQLFHAKNDLHIIGIEKNNKINLESDLYRLFGQDHDNELEDIFRKNNNKIKYYEFYEHIAKKYLKTKSISENNYKTVFDFQFDIKFEDYEKKNDDKKFDLILLSNVLHYKDMIDIHQILLDTNLLLKQKGLIYVTFPRVDDDKDRRKIDLDDFEKLFREYFNILDCSKKNEKYEGRITILGEKTPPNNIEKGRRF